MGRGLEGWSDLSCFLHFYLASFVRSTSRTYAYIDDSDLKSERETHTCTHRETERQTDRQRGGGRERERERERDDGTNEFHFNYSSIKHHQKASSGYFPCSLSLSLSFIYEIVPVNLHRPLSTIYPSIYPFIRSRSQWFAGEILFHRLLKGNRRHQFCIFYYFLNLFKNKSALVLST